MTDKLQRENKAKKITAEARARNMFDGNIKISVTTQKPCFSGCIVKLRDIKAEYNPQYPFHQTRYTPDYAFTKALETLIEHEITHRGELKGRGCPKNKDLDLTEILTPAAIVLKAKGFPNLPFGSQGHTLYTYFANLIADVVDNAIVSDNRGSEGIFLIYDDMGHHNGKFGDLFEGFLRVQAGVSPKRDGAASLVKYFKHSPKVREAVNNCLKRTGLADMPREKRVEFLSKSQNWRNVSEVFTDELSKLLDPTDLSASYFPVFGGNDFARLDDEDVQMQIAMRAYEKEGDKFEPPVFMDDNRALLSVYRQLAKKIEMKVQSHSVETERPVSHVSLRQFDLDRDPIERLQFGYGEMGRLEAQIGKFPLKVKSRYQVSAGNFPEVRFGLLDCSDSTRRSLGGEKEKVMNPWAKEEKQWTDNSIYHRELLEFFGLCELFRRKGTLKSANTRLGVFSDSTRIGSNLGESERLALQPSFGGTYLNKSVVKRLFEGQGSLVYTISDGEINNWSSLKDSFIENAKRHHYFHLQIGGESQMYRDLRDAKLLAIRDDGKSTAPVLIDLTQKEIFGGTAK